MQIVDECSKELRIVTASGGRFTCAAFSSGVLLFPSKIQDGVGDSAAMFRRFRARGESANRGIGMVPAMGARMVREGRLPLALNGR